MKRKKESAEGLADDALFLGVDVGTQGVKAVIYDLHSKQVVGLGSRSYGLQTDPLRPGMAEQHPSIWWTSGLEAILDAIKKCSDIDPTNRSRIKGVGVSGQQHGLVVLDENKEVIRPAKLWCDVESAKEAEELSEKFGWKMGAAFTATKLLWLKRNEPENFAKIRHVMMPKDFFNYMLVSASS
jgi:xylulokinase